MGTNDSTAKNHPSLSITPLNGQDNFTKWWREFRTLARAKNYWALFTGEEQLLAKPERKDYFVSIKDRTQTDSQEMNNVVGSIEEYRLDVDLYEKQLRRAGLATELLLAQIKPALRGLLADSTSPKATLDLVKAQHHRKGPLALLNAYGAIAEVSLYDHDYLIDYFQELCLRAEDIKDLGGLLSDDQFQYHLIHGLTEDFDEFVRFFRLQLGSPSAPPASPETTKALLKQLLMEEASSKLKTPMPNQRSLNGK